VLVKAKCIKLLSEDNKADSEEKMKMLMLNISPSEAVAEASHNKKLYNTVSG